MKTVFKSTMFFSLVVFAFLSNVNAQWQYQKAPISTIGISLRSVYFSSPEKGWAVGTNGAIVHTKDGGDSWENHSIDTIDERLNSVFFVSDSVGWIIGNRGVALSTRDGGLNWSIFEVDTEVTSLTSIFFISESTGYITSSFGYLYSTKDSGKSWEKKDFNAFGFNSVYFINHTHGYLLGGSSLSFKTTDGGNNWHFLDSLGFITNKKNAQFHLTEDIGFVVGKSSIGNILKTTDGGKTWKGSGIGWNTFESVHFPTPDYGWAVGRDGIIAQTNDGGENWKIQKPNNTFLYSVFFTSENHGIAVGDNGAIMKYSGNTSLNEKKSDLNKIKIYPNPAGNHFTVEVDPTLINYEYEIIDLMGKQVIAGTLYSESSNINIAHLSNGIYYFQILTNAYEVNEVKKIVVCQ